MPRRSATWAPCTHKVKAWLKAPRRRWYGIERRPIKDMPGHSTTWAPCMLKVKASLRASRRLCCGSEGQQLRGTRALFKPFLSWRVFEHRHAPLRLPITQMKETMPLAARLAARPAVRAARHSSPAAGANACLIAARSARGRTGNLGTGLRACRFKPHSNALCFGGR